MIKNRYILGIQSYANQNSGACIVRFSDDGKILDVVAISEERLIRIKHPYVFPLHSIGYCMDYFGLTGLDQIDLLITDYIRIKRWFNSGPAYNITDFDYLKIKFDIDLRKIRIITHHMAHAASAYYSSGFNEAAILVVDGNGSDLETTSYFKAKGYNIRLIENYKYRGLGTCYNAVTRWILGLGSDGEGKTMGLAPYGARYKKVLHIKAGLEGIKNDFSNFMIRMPYSDVLDQIDPLNKKNPLKDKYKICRQTKDLLNPYFSRAAYDIQEESERVLVHLAKDLYRKTRLKNICIAGGVGLNSVSNKIILDKTDFEEIFVFPACSDAGAPFGLAMWGYYNCKELGTFKRKRFKLRNAYLGKGYLDEDIICVLKRYGIPYTDMKLSDVARLLSQGKVIGWLQGGSEYGPRALGHRSILADSRNKAIKDILNLRIKHREPFRPYAPSILREHYAEYFDLDRDSPYMLLIAEVKKPAAVPAITHIDRTARVQTVTKEDNGIFYDLINEFYKITGVPCILNTSFNDAGEPMVETPEDAIIRFLKSAMGHLVVGNYLINAKDLHREKRRVILKQMIKDREERIKMERTKLIRKYFKGYDERERDYFIRESNKISEWYVKYKCEYELEKKVLEWVENKKRILIVGTKDHTAILPKYINGFFLLNIVGFCNYKGHVDMKKSRTEYREYNLNDIKRIPFDEILVSSYEYNFEIYDHLKKMNLNRPIYAIYDNTSRNFMDIFESLPPFKYR